MNEYYELIPAKIRIDEEDSIELFKEKKELEKIEREEKERIEEEKRISIEIKDEKSEKEYQEELKNKGISFFPAIDTIMGAVRTIKQNEKAINKSISDALKSVEHIKIDPYYGLISTQQRDAEEDGSFDMDKKDAYYEKFIALYQEKYNQWDIEAIKIIELIFDNYVRTKQYKEAKADFEARPMRNFLPGRREVDDKLSEFFDTNRDIKAKIKFLQELYFDIEKECKSPLSYLKDRSTLCYYDFVCELKADTKESLLCEYMFDFPIGSKKEISDIYCFIEGVNEDDLLKADNKKIINAMEGVNKKTQKFLGFSVFCKEKSVVYVQMKH